MTESGFCWCSWRTSATWFWRRRRWQHFEKQNESEIDLFTSAHAAPIVPSELVDKVITFQKGAKSGSRAFFSQHNLGKLISLRGRRYDTVVFFHHFTLRAGVYKFWLIAKASGARRIAGLKNCNVGFLTDYVVDEGFGARHEAQYWLDIIGLLGAKTQARPAIINREPLRDDAAGPTRDRTGVPRVVIHAGSGGYSVARRWPVERFAAAARHLHRNHRAEIVLVGEADDDSNQVARMLDFPAQKPGRNDKPAAARRCHPRR